MRRRLKDKISQIAWGLNLNVKFTVIIVTLVLIPIIAFTLVFFKNLETNLINERKNAMEYSISKTYDEILKNVDSINMSTQFFLSDKALEDYLVKVINREEITYEEMMQFYNVNIASLERMVNNNPYLYQIRLYVDAEHMEEMMPILYRYSRMKRLPWSEDEDLRGWKFDYSDTIFDTFGLNQGTRILSLVTPITVYANGQIGVLEVAMKMETMFPFIYNENQNIFACFLDERGTVYCREEIKEQMLHYTQLMAGQMPFEGLESHVEYKKLEGRPVIIGMQYVKEVGVTLLWVDDLQESIGTIHANRNFLLGVLLIISVVLILFINYVVKKLLKQFYKILESIREVQKGDLNVVIENCGRDEMGELGTQINKMLERIRQLMEDNLNRELLVKNSEIRALQNQINAHFIYNVLESIKMMAEIEEKFEISDAITALGNLLRYSMRWASGNVTIGEELEYIKNYLALINLRFDYEIYLSLKIPESLLKQEIPKMSLQPIVENAIYHGIEQMAEDTNIYIKGRIEDNDCVIEITDAGKGMSEEQVKQLYLKINGEVETNGGSGNGIGLKNVQDRIKMNFGEKYGITISSKLDCFTKIQIRIPMTHPK